MTDINPAIITAELNTDRCFSNCIADSSFYRININDLCQILSSKGRLQYSADDTHTLLTQVLEYKDIAAGWAPEEWNSDQRFANDDGNYLFLKVKGQEEGKRLEQLLKDWANHTAEMLAQISE